LLIIAFGITPINEIEIRENLTNSLVSGISSREITYL